MKNHEIARFHPQGWRFATRRIGITVERAAVHVRHIASREFRFQHPVSAAHIFRFLNHTSNRGTWTNRLARWLGTCWSPLERRSPGRYAEKKNRYPSKSGHVKAAIAWL